MSELFTFVPAKRHAELLLIGIIGPSSSGKTYSALAMATGLAGGGLILGIDTEHRRMTHYAGDFHFEHLNFEKPFSPERYAAVLEAAYQRDPAVVIVDSMSHEHAGPGGMLDMHDRELDRVAGDVEWKRDKMSFGAWREPKRQHKAMMDVLLRAPCHVICCFRAEPKVVMLPNKEGKLVPTDIGFQPIRASHMEYEMAVNVVLPPQSKGVPDLSHQASRVIKGLEHIFTPGRRIDETVGRELGAWARGEQTIDPALEDGIAAAGRGMDDLRAWWGSLASDAKQRLQHKLDALKAKALEADAQEQPQEPPPGPEEPPLPDEPPKEPEAPVSRTDELLHGIARYSTQRALTNWWNTEAQMLLAELSPADVAYVEKTYADKLGRL